MKVGLIQYNPIWEDKKANQRKLEGFLKNRAKDTSLLIFPEMSLTGFTMSSQKYAEDLNGETTHFFQTLARKHGCHVIAGLIESATPLPFNSLIHVLPNGTVSTKYRKMHTIPVYDENIHYQNGAAPAFTSIGDFTYGLSICFDLRFPELYRSYLDQNVTAFINIANWPAVRSYHWESLLRARAIENQCYVIGVNRVGEGNGITYRGGSVVFDPLGEQLCHCSDKEGLFNTELEIDLVTETRRSFPVLDSRTIKR